MSDRRFPCYLIADEDDLDLFLRALRAGGELVSRVGSLPNTPDTRTARHAAQEFSDRMLDWADSLVVFDSSVPDAETEH